ncbi:MAG: exodeoxyribonuclease VII large subunit [Clostridia bacterium]|nr:exodeoxyribonuclease VII large subunit [Clostridia bacterium]
MPVITVSQLNNYMRRYVDNNSNLSGLYIKGEISNFKRHSSGHLYLTLKDSGSVLKCVMFQSYAASLKFSPENGMKVIAFGRVSVYEAGGVYQLYIEQIIPDGKGELYAAYEQLKAQLEALGYFDPAHKMPLPQYPGTIGVVTSPEGAAVRDVLSVLGRRFPLAEILIYPAQVQGIGASDTIVSGIEYFNATSPADVLIIGRGGGSIEDLWAFNERNVADAIYNSHIPIISAVGHETDFTIADFVADMRAPTPSAAAEMAVPDCTELYRQLKMSSDKLATALSSTLKIKRNKFEALMRTNMDNLLIRYIQDKKIYTDDIIAEMTEAYENTVAGKRNSFSTLCAKLDALSPVKVLSRGYSVARTSKGIVSSVADVAPGDDIDITLNDGTLNCQVKQIQ